MSEPTGTVSQVASSPPIVEIARFVGQALQKSYGLASRIAITIVRSLIAPITLLYHPVSYLLAPVTVLAQVLLDLFVFTPYAITLSVVRNVYPLYVFVGAACICALLVGFVARAFATALVRALFAPRRAGNRSRDISVSPVEHKSEKSSLKKVPSKTRLRKRVSIKEERDG